MNISETNEFKKDFKKLFKKYKSIKDDFNILKRVVQTEPLGDGTKHWNCLRKIEERNISFFKVRMMCRTVKGSDFRVTYMYDGEKVELLFIEMFFKGKKNNNDQKRINGLVKLYTGTN
jgi:hypothetical protein